MFTCSCFAICAILVLYPCVALPNLPIDAETVIQVATQYNNSVANLKVKRAIIWNILSPLRANPMEEDAQDADVVSVDIPKITLWEFPSERRAFVDDTEVFVISSEVGVSRDKRSPRDRVKKGEIADDALSVQVSEDTEVMTENVRAEKKKKN